MYIGFVVNLVNYLQRTKKPSIAMIEEGFYRIRSPAAFTLTLTAFPGR